MAKSKLMVFFALVLLFSVPAGLVYADGHTSGTAVVSDGNAMSDVLTVMMEDATQPDDGMHLVAWLLSDDGEMKMNVGALSVDANGDVSHTYVSPSGANLLADYGQFAITMESNPAASDASGDPVLIGYMAGEANLEVARMLLIESDEDPMAGSITQLRAQVSAALDNANMARAAESQGDLDKYAQMAIDVIDADDGIVALANAAIMLADEAGASKVSATAGNASAWSMDAKDSLDAAMDASSLLAAKSILSTATGLLNSALNGVDATGDGGANQAYVAAQGLATFSIEQPRPEPEPVEVEVGDSAIPMLAQLAMIAALALLAAGSAMVIKGRRSRA